VSGDRIRASFAQNVALLRLQAAWDVARVLNLRPFWLALSGKAMETLNVSMAIKVYRFLGDAGMVMALEQLQDVEDKNLLAGHIALLFGDYSQVCGRSLASGGCVCVWPLVARQPGFGLRRRKSYSCCLLVPSRPWKCIVISCTGIKP
jgi:hypothetical protein